MGDWQLYTVWRIRHHALDKPSSPPPPPPPLLLPGQGIDDMSLSLQLLIHAEARPAGSSRKSNGMGSVACGFRASTNHTESLEVHAECLEVRAILAQYACKQTMHVRYTSPNSHATRYFQCSWNNWKEARRLEAELSRSFVYFYNLINLPRVKHQLNLRPCMRHSQFEDSWGST